MLSDASKGRYDRDKAIEIRNAAKRSVGSVMPAKSLELQHTIRLIRELDKLLAYAGLSPSTYQSGKLNATGAYAHMEKRGSRYLRYALFNAAKYVCHWEPSFAAYLARKRTEGKHYNVAISHAAKKLLRLIFALQQSGRAFQAKDLRLSDLLRRRTDWQHRQARQKGAAA